MIFCHREDTVEVIKTLQFEDKLDTFEREPYMVLVRAKSEGKKDIIGYGLRVSRTTYLLLVLLFVVSTDDAHIFQFAVVSFLVLIKACPSLI